MQPTLMGDLLQVRPLAREDFDALYQVASDPLVWEQHPASDRWKREVFSALFDRLLSGGGGLVIVDKTNGEPIGSSSYYEYRPAERDIVIGYTFLARRCWGGLYNSELKSLMLAHAFRFVDRVWFHVGAENWRSQRAMEKVGARLSHRAIRESGGVVSEFLHYVIGKS
jgi:RimJ/RimL family protein N-acetyltransferase